MFETCSACKQETLILTEPIYDGFTKIGDRRTCSSCGADLFAGDPKPSPSKADPLASLFGDDAAPEKIDLFDVEAETGKMCRKCVHYVLHPFTQRCGLHDREVQATDSCPQFEKG
jgi:hypothetical protein